MRACIAFSKPFLLFFLFLFTSCFKEKTEYMSGSTFFYLFIWLCWVFVAARGFSLVASTGGSSSLRCAGFSLQWFLLLRSSGFRRASFSSCGT